MPSEGGVYEIRVNGDLIHSKKETGEFPTNEAVVAEVGKRLGQTT